MNENQIKNMKTNANKKMIMSVGPLGLAIITMHDAGQIQKMAKMSDAQMCETYRSSSDDTTTEILPMTEDAYAAFAARHNCQPVHPTLAAYPYPRD